MSITKNAVLSMDIEDWYQLFYFQGKNPDSSYSMLDGVNNYVDLLNKHDIKTTFFVLSELADKAKEQILYAHNCGHEIAVHGKTHTRPVLQTPEEFERDITDAKNRLSDLIGEEVIGYRAPCYSIDNERYEIVKNVGFKYSSSRMDVPDHPLYGELDLTGYSQPFKGVYEKDGFTEFALSTAKLCGKHIAVSGGGWIRLFPWSAFMRPMIKKYLTDAETYTLYIHPFELSKRKMPKVNGVSLLTDIRSHKGLGKVDIKIEELITMLTENGFTFSSFGQLRKSLLQTKKNLVI